MQQFYPWLLALVAGCFLALMIAINGQMAAQTSPMLASWLAHGVGAVAALMLVALLSRKRQSTRTVNGPAPWWSYLGGVPGAFVVVLSAIAVNSPLGLTGTLALGIVGQTFFGLMCDQFGWFGLPQRRLTMMDGVITSCFLTGGLLLILARST